MTDDLKAKIDAAVKAAIDAVQESEKQVGHEPEDSQPHRFGTFRLPPGTHIKGFSKFAEE